MVARLASIAKWHQKVAGSSPAVVITFLDFLSMVFLLVYYPTLSNATMLISPQSDGIEHINRKLAGLQKYSEYDPIFALPELTAPLR